MFPSKKNFFSAILVSQTLLTWQNFTHFFGSFLITPSLLKKNFFFHNMSTSSTVYSDKYTYENVAVPATDGRLTLELLDALAEWELCVPDHVLAEIERSHPRPSSFNELSAHLCVLEEAIKMHCK